MHFVRLFGGGLDKNRADPRDKVWAEYHCSLCGQDSEIDVTRVVDTYQYDVERRCPHCKQINSEDKIQSLKAQLDKLTADKNRIDIEIERVEREMNSFNNKIISK